MSRLAEIHFGRELTVVWSSGSLSRSRPSSKVPIVCVLETPLVLRLSRETVEYFQDRGVLSTEQLLGKCHADANVSRALTLHAVLSLRRSELDHDVRCGRVAFPVKLTVDPI